jgi:hypothetical protein
MFNPGGSRIEPVPAHHEHLRRGPVGFCGLPAKDLQPVISIEMTGW